MIIRLEEENDYLKVEKMVRNSFWNIYRSGAFEHYIVHNLRADESFIRDLAYVIEKDGKIIAHINYSKGKILFNNKKVIDGVVLGPISVDCDYQNQGYGSKLINYTLKLIEDRDIPFVVVIGDENYYHRFGFESASKYNLYLDGTDTNEECPFFMIKIFKEDIDLLDGTFYNPDVFNVNQSDVDEFDNNFEYKEKLVLKGQLEV